MEKERGILGIRNLTISYKVLVEKWSSKFMSERNPFLRRTSCRPIDKEEGSALKRSRRQSVVVRRFS